MTSDLGAIAQDAFAWIESQAVEVDGGCAWLENDELFDYLYAGTAGVLLGCVEAKSADLAADVVDLVALAARDRLVHLVRTGGELAGDDADNALFTGWAGVAVALRAWSRVADDEEAREAADAVLRSLAGKVMSGTDNPSTYTDVISGDAGILLALLEGEPTSIGGAVSAVVDRLLAVVEDGPGGPQWRMVDGWHALMPGFSHGTAGVAYALALAGRAYGRPDLVELAAQAGDGLISIAGGVGNWTLPTTIPLSEGSPLVYYGWCHGPTGTSRLFLLLDELDPQPRWATAIEACEQALRDSRIPERLYPGYWDNVARCCGSAGVGQHLLDRYVSTGDVAYREWSKRLADDVVSRTVRQGIGVAWSNTEHKNPKPELPPQPGFMQGAAGVAGWLARLDRASSGGELSTRSPNWV